MIKTKKVLATLGILLLIPAGLSQQTNNSFIPEPGLTPGNPFYFLDQISETIELMVGSAPVIGSQELEAKIRANHAAERLAEAEKMLEKNKTIKAEKMLQEYSRLMNKSLKEAKNHVRIREKLAKVTRRQTQKLEQVKQKIPESARKGIQNAIEANKHRMKAFNPTGKPGKKRGNKPAKPSQREKGGKGPGGEGLKPDNISKEIVPGGNGSQEKGSSPFENSDKPSDKNRPDKPLKRQDNPRQENSLPESKEEERGRSSKAGPPGSGVASY